MTLHVTLPDGSSLELDDGASVRDAAAAIGPRLAKAAIAGRVTAPDEPDVTLLVDATAPLHDGDKLDIVTLKGDDPDAVDIQRHTASHVMAQAIVHLFPGARYAIGPTIENGFYYDLQLPEPIAEADLARIEKEMGKV
ncbi:MAG TPA: TGS domain-containing protein, partial [Thermoleophilia bacterium]|nr:TGS domain-containing protein [Thermoleophilia bacterium]